MRRLSLIVTLLIATAAQAETHTFRFLLPIYMEQTVNGAYGSMWESTFAMRNTRETPYLIQWCSTDPTKNEGCPLNLFPDESLEPGETQTALPQRYPKPENSNAGALVYMNSEAPHPDDGSGIALQLRVRDLSRNASSAGTEIPVVRESAFRTSTLHLLAIPTDSRFRLLLRVYEVNATHAEFALRVYDDSTGEQVDERILTLMAPPQGTPHFQPAYAQVSDLASHSELTSGGTLRIEIQPLTAGSAFWAFISITNNDTQEFTVITPQ